MVALLVDPAPSNETLHADERGEPAGFKTQRDQAGANHEQADHDHRKQAWKRDLRA
jgi:hypothetical protein